MFLLLFLPAASAQASNDTTLSVVWFDWAPCFALQTIALDWPGDRGGSGDGKEKRKKERKHLKKKKKKVFHFDHFSPNILFSLPLFNLVCSEVHAYVLILSFR